MMRNSEGHDWNSIHFGETLFAMAILEVKASTVNKVGPFILQALTHYSPCHYPAT